MKAYSEDLRERIVRAVLIGTPRDDVAARFAVSSATITRWLRMKRETGSLAPKLVPGPVAVKTEAVMAALAQAPAALDAPAERLRAVLHRPLPLPLSQAARAARRVVPR